MKNSFGKWLSVLLCALMVIGGLNLGTVACSATDLGITAVGREASSRAVKSVNTTTFVDWRAGIANNITVYNQSGGELRLGAFEVFTIPVPGNNGVRDLEVDSNSNLYIATQIGSIIKIDSITGAVTDHGRAVPDESNLNRLKMDKNDTLWIGGRSFDASGQGNPTRGGILSRMSTSTMRFDTDWRIISLTANPASTIGQIRGLTADKNGTIWVGSVENNNAAYNGLLARVDPTTGVMTRINSGNPLINGYGIYQLAATQNGTIYAGTMTGADGGHLIKIDPSTNTFTVLNGHNPLVNGDSIQSMAVAKNGTLYIGTSGAAGNLFMLDPATDKLTNLGKPYAGVTTVSDLYPAPDGSVYGWMGSNAIEPRLLWIQAGTGYRIDMGVPIPGVAFPGSLTVAPDGTVWGSGPNSQLFKFAPYYQTFPAARLDRSASGRLFTENYELSDNIWETASSIGTTNFKRVTDNSRPVGDRTVFEQQDTTSTAAYARAGAWGPIASDADTFSMNPAGVMEIQIKFVAAAGGGSSAPWDTRLFMCADNYGNNYALFFDEVSNTIRLYRDWGQIGSTYTAMSLERGYWYDVKWKVYHTGVGPGAAFNVWINGTKIFNEVPLGPMHHLSGAVAVGTRAYDSSFDNVRLYKDTNITVNGLQAGQKVDLYADNGTLLSSGTAAGVSVKLNVENVSFPLSGYFTLTATDGSTVVLTTSIMKDIYGGDVYNFVSPVTAGSTWRYLSKGTFLSQPYDALATVTWLNISWNGLKPANTNISLMTRTAATMAGLVSSAWSAPYWASPDTAITSPKAQWIQFRANLSTTDMTKTPELQDVTIKHKAFPNFTIGLTQSTSVLYPNNTISYDIYYNNTGNGIAKDVIIADILGPDLVFVNSSAEPARKGSTWLLKNILPGTKNVLTVQARVALDAKDKTVIQNRATIEFTDLDNLKMGNFTSPTVVATVIRPLPNATFGGPATAGPGDLIEYNITYNNTGTGTAKDLWLDMTFDKNLTFVSSSDEAVRNGTIWNITNVVGNAKGNVTVTAKVNASVADGTKLKSKLDIEFSMPNGDQPSGFYIGSVETTVSRPLIEVGKNVDVASALPGDTIVYKVFFNNTGSAAGKVTLTDALAPELELVNSSADTNRTGNVWTFSSVPAGSHNELTIRARIKDDTPENSTINNTATLNLSMLSGLALGQLTTNQVSTKVGSPKFPFIAVVMVADKVKASWNDTVVFKVYYNNTGYDIAGTVSIKDQLPKGLTFVATSAEANRAGMFWNFTSVTAGDHFFTITTRVFSGTPNNTVEKNIVFLNYTDAKGKAKPGSQSSASVMVTVPIQPHVDTTRPSITDRKPAPDAKDVPTDSRIEITFSEAMNRSETERALTISPKVAGKITWEGNTLVFTPDKPLKKGQKYTITIEPYAEDLAGNALNPVSSWSFTVKGKTVVNQSTNWLCLAGIIAAIVALVVGVVYMLTRRKAQKAPAARPSPRTAPAYVEAMDKPTTVAPRPKPRPVQKVAMTTVAEEVSEVPEETVAEEPAEVNVPEVTPAEEEKIAPGPPEPVVAPPEPVLEEKAGPGPPEPVEKPPEPVKEEKTEPVEEKQPEPVQEQKVGTPGPKAGNLDDILKRLRQ
jgi:uncharacterized repeat protein (TIGR01451 family)